MSATNRIDYWTRRCGIGVRVVYRDRRHWSLRLAFYWLERWCPGPCEGRHMIRGGWDA